MGIRYIEKLESLHCYAGLHRSLGTPHCRDPRKVGLILDVTQAE